MSTTDRIEPPGRPRGPADRPGPPAPARLDPWLEERLFEQRIVLLQGRVTDEVATRVAAQLLTLDATADDSVRLHLACPDGELGAVFSLIDTLDLLRVPVVALATGEVGGAALGVLCSAGRRSAYPHARFRLAEPSVDHVAGTADEVAGLAGRHLRMLEDLVLRLAEVTGRTQAEVERDMSDGGRVLSAPEAVEYGLVQEIVGGR